MTESQVSSYRLVYSDVVSDIISEMGIIPRAKIAVDSSDVLAGSLTPLAPGSQQSVTIRLNRTHLYNPLYFTISSLMDNIQVKSVDFFAVRHLFPLQNFR